MTFNPPGVITQDFAARFESESVQIESTTRDHRTSMVSVHLRTLSSYRLRMESQRSHPRLGHLLGHVAVLDNSERIIFHARREKIRRLNRTTSSRSIRTIEDVETESNEIHRDPQPRVYVSESEEIPSNDIESSSPVDSYPDSLISFFESANEDDDDDDDDDGNDNNVQAHAAAGALLERLRSSTHAKQPEDDSQFQYEMDQLRANQRFYASRPWSSDGDSSSSDDDDDYSSSSDEDDYYYDDDDNDLQFNWGIDRGYQSSQISLPTIPEFPELDMLESKKECWEVGNGRIIRDPVLSSRTGLVAA